VRDRTIALVLPLGTRTPSEAGPRASHGVVRARFSTRRLTPRDARNPASTVRVPPQLRRFLLAAGQGCRRCLRPISREDSRGETRLLVRFSCRWCLLQQLYTIKESTRRVQFGSASDAARTQYQCNSNARRMQRECALIRCDHFNCGSQNSIVQRVIALGAAWRGGERYGKIKGIVPISTGRGKTLCRVRLLRSAAKTDGCQDMDRGRRFLAFRGHHSSKRLRAEVTTREPPPLVLQPLPSTAIADCLKIFADLKHEHEAPIFIGGRTFERGADYRQWASRFRV
jgi:hypothetical protein